MSVGKNVSQMTLATGISRIFGMVRMILFAHLLGVGFIADAFYLANKIPNLFRRLFAEGAMNSSFVPIFSHLTRNNKKTDESSDFFNTIFTYTLFFLLFLCILCIFYSKEIISFFYFITPNHPDLKHISTLLSIMFPYLLFISIAALFQGVLNIHGNFLQPAITPILLNIVLIITASSLILYQNNPKSSSLILSIAFSFGGFIQAIYLYYYVRQINYSLRFKVRKVTSSVKQFFTLLIPILFSSSLYQLNQFILDPLALSLGEGSLSALLYSLRLQELPLGVFVVSITTVFLVKFSFLIKENKLPELHELLQKSFGLFFLMTIPFLALGLTLKVEIVTLLFSSTLINNEATLLIASCLFFQFLAVLPIGISRIYQSLFFAFKETRTPVVYGLLSTLVNVILAIFLTKYLNYGVSGLAFSAMIASFLYCALLYWKSFSLLGNTISWKTVKLFFFLGVFSGISIFISSWIVAQIEINFLFNKWTHVLWNNKWLALWEILMTSFFFSTILASLLYLSKLTELTDLLKDIRVKFQKKS